MIKEEKKPELFALNIEDKKTIARLEQMVKEKELQLEQQIERNKQQKEMSDQDKRKIGELRQALTTEKLISWAKDQTIATQNTQLKSQEETLQRQQQAMTAQHQPSTIQRDELLQQKATEIQFYSDEIQRYYQAITTQHQQLNDLVQTLDDKENELKTIKVKKTELELRVVKLERALQELVDSEYVLKMQVQEYQKYQEKEKKTKIVPPKAPSSMLSFFNENEPLKFQPVRDEKNLNLLLKWVVEGHLEEVEKLLKSKPELSLMEGNVKDLSGREFKGITALQYAHWALDAEMMEVIVKYTDKVEVLNQLKSFESNPAKYSTHGVHYDNSVLVQKMTEYLNNYSKWNAEQCCTYWQKEIGSTQRMCPAWLVYAMCEEGENVAWTQKDEKRKVKRQYEKAHLKWWFDMDSIGGKLGDKWAVARGREGVRTGCGWCIKWLSTHDKDVHVKLRSNRTKVVEDLKTQLTAQNYSGGNSGTSGNELLKSQPESQTSTYLQSQQPKAPSGTSSFFKEGQPPKSQPVRDEKNLNLLLKWVVEGHLEKAEKLLKSKPELVLMEGNVKDLSGREFKGITVLQYAHWALDAEMMEVIVKYTDKAEVLNQLKSFESNPGKYSTHGVHYDNSVLLDKMQEYLNNCGKWNYDQCCSYWQKEVGGAQRMCPAWLVYAMCEEGKDVAWTKKDVQRKVKRQYDKEHLKWWYVHEYNGGKKELGERWGACRGWSTGCGWYIEGKNSHLLLKYDKSLHGEFGKQSVKVVDDLKARLTRSHNNMGK